MYHRLMKRFGPRGWWPGDSSFEHFIGCILAQNTRWDRVEPVIAALKDKGLLAPSEFLSLPEEELAEMLRGSGTYRRKAEYLRIAGEFMLSLGWNGSADSVTEASETLRKNLLALKGIGPETCDCILLYVLKRPFFVVDAYTKRILSRHGFCRERESYSAVQELFHRELERNTQVFNEYHALLVECGKVYCRPVPRCDQCPLCEEETCITCDK
ncbi:endonuclease [Candidatus Fermentibacteria bacterium]|nr:MAG: endonuclease [Candidatus Fermentibacteria bacterium]